MDEYSYDYYGNHYTDFTDFKMSRTDSMKNNTQTLDDIIYNVLYKHSTVDGVRILHEDVWPIEELKEAIKQSLLANMPEKTHTYNQNKKDHCEYCGVKEGMFCKDGCAAMAERYRNNSIDDCIKVIEETLK